MTMAEAQTENLTAGVVAETYANALFELAEERNVLDEVGDELNQIAQLLNANADLRAVFDHPLIKKERLSNTLRNLFEGRISDTTYHFLIILNDKARLDQVVNVQIAFDQLAKQKRGEVDVELQTARELDAAQLQQVGDRISQAIGHTAILKPKTNPSLIGGMKIRVGDKLIDASLATQLYRMKDDIIAKAHELAAQEASDYYQNPPEHPYA